MVITKTCCGCKQDLPLDSFNKKTSDRQHGRAALCKDCAFSYRTVYYQENRAFVLAKGAEYRSANKPIIAERNKAYRNATKEAQKARRRRYYQAHTETIKEKQLRYYDEHKEQVDAARIRWRQAHPENVIAFRCKWNNANRGKITEKNKRYVKELAGHYVKRLIVRRLPIKVESSAIPPALVEAKRLQIKLIRIIKEKLNGKTNQENENA